MDDLRRKLFSKTNLNISTILEDVVSIEVKPTRSELIKLKNRIKLARTGYKLLKKKRDGLILEFFEVLKSAKNARQELTEAYTDARKHLRTARLSHTNSELDSVGMAVKPCPELVFKTRNIMGTVVPVISSDSPVRDVTERGYGLMTTSAAINNVASAYERLLEKVILAAEAETTMKKLLHEIDRTKRRVNALEYEVIPKLVHIRDFISFRLEEMERETIFRTKMMKKKFAARQR